MIKDKWLVAMEIAKIRDCIYLLNYDENIKNCVAFVKSNGCSTALYGFEDAFFGSKPMKYADVHTRGLYPIITKHRYGKDCDGIKGYIGQYSALENLRKVCLELIGEYFDVVKIKKSLNYGEFRSKIKQKAQEANRLLNEIVNLSGIQ